MLSGLVAVKPLLFNTLPEPMKNFGILSRILLHPAVLSVDK